MRLCASTVTLEVAAKCPYIKGRMPQHVEAAYRFRFYPTPEQADLLARTFGCVRVVYNRARAARRAGPGATVR